VNLPNPGPAFVGNYAAPLTGTKVLPLRIVTFNIKLGRRIGQAIEVLRSGELAGADIVALQEVDERGVDRIARALRLNYAYYPSAIHPTDHRHFGPALLSRWPIVSSRKLLLPYEGRFRRMRRTATVADLRIGDRPVRAYAVHLDPQIKITEGHRAEQMRVIATDARSAAGPVVIAGDLNSEGIGRVLQPEGYRWLSDRTGPTISIFAWDHILVRGFRLTRGRSVGVVGDRRGASDHHPVWATVILDAPRPASPPTARSR
ncbi:MAG: endonuclease/exonuclease/phosphatase family protein, partial [Gemmatimonadales bacterium]|nr:endonuclease/exonuclease/phosphatase family protein [Gemmatimonadales bacterium]